MPETMRRLRSKVTYANVMSTLAVVLAISGTAYGAGTLRIGGSSIDNGTITSVDVANNSLLSTDIHNGTLGKVDMQPALAQLIAPGPVAAHTEDNHQGFGYALQADMAHTTLTLPFNKNGWLLDLYAQFTPASNSQDAMTIGCVFVVDNQLVHLLPAAQSVARGTVQMLHFRDAKSVKSGKHTVFVRCTAGTNVQVGEAQLTAIGYRQ